MQSKAGRIRNPLIEAYQKNHMDKFTSLTGLPQQSRPDFGNIGGW